MKNSGFTLAEVLVTLGVIGIVAAMTLPSVINKIKEKQNIAMWKKKYSEIANIYNLVKDEFSTPICVDSINGDFKIPKECATINSPYATFTTLSPEFVKHFISHLKIVDSCSVYNAYGNTDKCSNYYRRWLGFCNQSDSLYELLPNKSPGKQKSPASCHGTLTNKASALNSFDFSKFAALLEDGSVIYFGGRATGWITVDVNGFDKGPNIVGKDVFAAMVNDKWIKPLGATDTYDQNTNGNNCECSDAWGNKNFSQGFLGSGDLLHGRMVSGGCCSAIYLYKK